MQSQHDVKIGNQIQTEKSTMKKHIKPINRQTIQGPRDGCTPFLNEIQESYGDIQYYLSEIYRRPLAHTPGE
jgi:hypothetical protein